MGGESDGEGRNRGEGQAGKALVAKVKSVSSPGQTSGWFSSRGLT